LQVSNIFVLVIAITASGYRLFLSMLGKVPEAKLGGKIQTRESCRNSNFVSGLGVVYSLVLAYGFLFVIVFTVTSTQKLVSNNKL
jgi:hypothetical protein